MVIILIHEGLLNAAFALHKTDTDSKPPSTFCETYKNLVLRSLLSCLFSACHLVFLPVRPSPWFDHDMGSQLQTWPSSRQCGGCLGPWWIHGYIYLGDQVPVARIRLLWKNHAPFLNLNQSKSKSKQANL